MLDSAEPHYVAKENVGSVLTGAKGTFSLSYRGCGTLVLRRRGVVNRRSPTGCRVQVPDGHNGCGLPGYHSSVLRTAGRWN